MTIGIYKIENTKTGDFYIGQSIDIRKRKWQHFFSLKREKHGSLPLQNDYNLYGKPCFLFSTILICEAYELDWYESQLISKLKPAYNTVLTGSPRQRKYLSPKLADTEELPGLEMSYKPLKWHRWVYGAGRH